MRLDPCIGFPFGCLANTLLAALAYKVRHGHKPVPLESDRFWWASACVGVGTTVLAYVAGGFAYVAFERGLYEVAVQVIFWGIFVVTAVPLVVWAYQLDNLAQGLVQLFIQLFFPVFVAVVVLLLFGSLHDVMERLAR